MPAKAVSLVSELGVVDADVTRQLVKNIISKQLTSRATTYGAGGQKVEDIDDCFAAFPAAAIIPHHPIYADISIIPILRNASRNWGPRLRTALASAEKERKMGVGTNHGARTLVRRRRSSDWAGRWFVSWERRLSDKLERTLTAYLGSIHVGVIHDITKVRSNLVEGGEIICEFVY